MTPDQLRAVLGAIGLPQMRVAHLLGISPRTVRSWLSGERDVPEPVARILRLAAAGKFNLDEMEK